MTGSLDGGDLAAPPAQRLFLTSGGLYCSPAPAIITTVLGSCVAVCLWDQQLGLGGMNHFVLPHATTARDDARYGDTAIEMLVHRMQSLGCLPAQMKAKIFGGAAAFSANGQDASIGARNVKLALEQMKKRRITVIARKTGGRNGLWVQFCTDTGKVLTRGLV